MSKYWASCAAPSDIHITNLNCVHVHYLQRLWNMFLTVNFGRDFKTNANQEVIVVFKENSCSYSLKSLYPFFLDNFDLRASGDSVRWMNTFQDPGPNVPAFSAISRALFKFWSKSSHLKEIRICFVTRNTFEEINTLDCMQSTKLDLKMTHLIGISKE